MKYLIILCLLLLCACGIRGKLERPENADPAYPRSYPIEK
jgi:predicted small lipoprotein YifL